MGGQQTCLAQHPNVVREVLRVVTGPGGADMVNRRRLTIRVGYTDRAGETVKRVKDKVSSTDALVVLFGERDGEGYSAAA